MKNLSLLLIILCLSMTSGFTWAAVYSHVQVNNPFINLHTGPGRGYPIFYVAKKGEWVDVLKQRTAWFKIRMANGKTGWVPREQMENTLTELGTPTKFRTSFFKEFLASRMEFGFSGGVFDKDPFLTASLGFRFQKHLSLEAAASQVSGAFSSSALYHINVVGHPVTDKRISPMFILGVGHFNNQPRNSLIQAIETDAMQANVGAGVRFYITRNFIIRGDYKYYTALIEDNRNQAFQSYSLGFSFFY